MGFSTGLRFFKDGVLSAFRRPTLDYLLLPALVSLVIVGAGLYFAIGYIDALSTSIRSLSWWPEFLSFIVDPLLYLAGVLAAAWLFSFIAAVIGSPFYGYLSQKIDPLTNVAPRPLWQEVLASLKREWTKQKYVLPRLLGVFFVGFIPVINILAPIIWLTYGGWLMAVQFSDYRFDNHGSDFRQALSKLRANRSASIGLGVGITLGMSIPLLNFIMAPLAVVAATQYARAIAQPRKP
jgi:CysZ protein